MLVHTVLMNAVWDFAFDEVIGMQKEYINVWIKKESEGLNRHNLN